MSSYESPYQSVVEIVDWSPRWSIGGVAANFARIQILLTVFDGNPDKWLDQIERTGSPDDEADVPFLVVIKQRLAEDPMLLVDMRRIVGEFAALFGGQHSQLQSSSLGALRID